MRENDLILLEFSNRNSGELTLVSWEEFQTGSEALRVLISTAIDFLIYSEGGEAAGRGDVELWIGGVHRGSLVAPFAPFFRSSDGSLIALHERLAVLVNMNALLVTAFGAGAWFHSIISSALVLTGSAQITSPALSIEVPPAEQAIAARLSEDHSFNVSVEALAGLAKTRGHVISVTFPDQPKISFQHKDFVSKADLIRNVRKPIDLGTGLETWVQLSEDPSSATASVEGRPIVRGQISKRDGGTETVLVDWRVSSVRPSLGELRMVRGSLVHLSDVPFDAESFPRAWRGIAALLVVEEIQTWAK